MRPPVDIPGEIILAARILFYATLVVAVICVLWPETCFESYGGW